MSCMAPRKRSAPRISMVGPMGVRLRPHPAAELGQRVHHLNGFVVGGLAELIDRRGRHLHQKESLCDALRVLLMPTF